jgi:hypothetical protein
VNRFNFSTDIIQQLTGDGLGFLFGLTGDEDSGGPKELAQAAENIPPSAISDLQNSFPAITEGSRQSRSNRLGIREKPFINAIRVPRAVAEIVDSNLIPGLGQSLNHALKTTGHDLQMIAHFLVRNFGGNRMGQTAVAVAVESELVIGEY